MSADWLELARPRLSNLPRRRTGHHLALFAWALPPHSGAGVYRPLSFMRSGCRRGWRIDAFCCEASGEQRQHGDELLAQVPPEATLHVLARSSREPSYRLFPHVDGGFTNALGHAHYASKTLANDPPDVVLASGPPFYTFVAAHFVARRFGVPLVLDYRDEWTECPFDFVSKAEQDRDWEQRCLRRADAVLFTTVSHLRHQLSKFPVVASRKAYVVPNGWEPSDFQDHMSERRAAGLDNALPLRIAHVGHAAGHAPPNEFLDSLEQFLINEPDWVPRIRVQFIGRRSLSADKAMREFRFPSVIERIDHVGKREANQRMRDSDLLLLIATPKLERYLPGKLFDYLAARRPVLVFGSRGESATLVDQLGAGVLCPPGAWMALRDALLHLRKMDMLSQNDSADTWLQAHRRDVVASQAFSIIESVVSDIS